MPSSAALPPAGITLTSAGLLQGARVVLPLAPGLLVFAAAFGAAAAPRGLDTADALAMSGIVFAGASQMLSLELWRPLWTPGAILAVALVTMTVNARFILMSASLHPVLRGRPLHEVVACVLFLTDVNWLIATRYHAEGGRDLGVLLGSGLTAWVLWVAGTLPGHWAGSLVPDPRVYALDLVMPIFFACMGASLWRGVVRSGLPWVAAATAALLTQARVPGFLFVIVGTLVGAVVGAFIRDDR